MKMKHAHRLFSFGLAVLATVAAGGCADREVNPTAKKPAGDAAGTKPISPAVLSITRPPLQPEGPQKAKPTAPSEEDASPDENLDQPASKPPLSEADVERAVEKAAGKIRVLTEKIDASSIQHRREMERLGTTIERLKADEVEAARAIAGATAEARDAESQVRRLRREIEDLKRDAEGRKIVTDKPKATPPLPRRLVLAWLTSPCGVVFEDMVPADGSFVPMRCPKCGEVFEARLKKDR